MGQQAVERWLWKKRWKTLLIREFNNKKQNKNKVSM
jgi:hypothetical protein